MAPLGIKLRSNFLRRSLQFSLSKKPRPLTFACRVGGRNISVSGGSTHMKKVSNRRVSFPKDFWLQWVLWSGHSETVCFFLVYLFLQFQFSMSRSITLRTYNKLTEDRVSWIHSGTGFQSNYHELEWTRE